MLFGSDVAQHCGTVPADHCRPDSGRDVIVAWSDVRNQRTQRVERRFVAVFNFFFDLLFDLVQRDVARSFDHYLHIMFPSFFGEFAESF